MMQLAMFLDWLSNGGIEHKFSLKIVFFPLFGLLLMPHFGLVLQSRSPGEEGQ